MLMFQKQIISAHNRQIIVNRQFIQASPLLYRQFSSSLKTLNEIKKDAAKPTTSTPTPTTAPSPVATPVEKKKTLWEKVKHEVQHYWDGTKLLGLEIKVSSKLALKSAGGYELTRRENAQLQRTTQDIVRLVPFSMFVIVPFAELLLPVALKLFPNLLPSTYESNADKEKKTLTLRATRKNVSNLLRGTVHVKLPSTATEEEKSDFKDFLQKLKAGLEPPPREQLLRVARLFKDDTVLDNLPRPQLVALAKYINLQPIGTNQLLRFRIRGKLLNIKTDDRAIFYEGVDSLTTPELQVACAARGLRVAGVSATQLNHDLNLWLNLRLKEKLPATLLILSNAYTYGKLESDESILDALQAVLSSMPEEVVHVAEVDVVEQVSNKQRLEVIKEQEALIHTEIKQDNEDGIIVQVKDKKTLDDEHLHHKEAEPSTKAEEKAETKTEAK